MSIKNEAMKIVATHDVKVIASVIVEGLDDRFNMGPSYLNGVAHQLIAQQAFKSESERNDSLAYYVGKGLERRAVAA